jgi:hypothetical protein
MLNEDFDNFEKGPPTQIRFKELLGNGIFNVNGERTWLCAFYL